MCHTSLAGQVNLTALSLPLLPLLWTWPWGSPPPTALVYGIRSNGLVPITTHQYSAFLIPEHAMLLLCSDPEVLILLYSNSNLQRPVWYTWYHQMTMKVNVFRYCKKNIHSNSKKLNVLFLFFNRFPPCFFLSSHRVTVCDRSCCPYSFFQLFLLVWVTL